MKSVVTDSRSSRRGFFFGVVLLLTGFTGLPLAAQQGAPAPATEGTEFFVSFPPSDPDAQNQFMGVMITSEFSTNGTIEIPDVASITNPWDTIRSYTTRPFSVRAGEVTMIEINRLVEPFYPNGQNAELNHNGEISLRAVRVTSRAPISVTAVNARQGSSGAYAPLPVERWGLEYTPISLPATPNNLELTSQLVITAAYDDTEVEVYPSAQAGRWDVGERIPEFTLNRGQIWLLQADAVPGTDGSMDLSGTTIRATKPISVVAGHTRASLSTNVDEVFPRSMYAAWHATVQMPADKEEFGNEYITTPLRSTGDRFRLIANQSNTVINLKLYDENGNVAGETSVSLRWKGEVRDVVLPDGLALNRPARWSALKPFALYQIRTTQGDYSSPENRPALLRVVPTSQYATRSAVALPNAFRGESFSDFTGDIVVSGTTDPLANVTLNGLLLSGLPGVSSSLITGNTWHVTLPLTAGKGHVLETLGGASITGRVGGSNGSTSGVSLDWTLPHWNPSVDYDRDPPYLVSKQDPSPSVVEVLVSDRTESYFSGVNQIEVLQSPGWERQGIAISPDPDVDGTARFGVKSGVDPSGPLQILLSDRDGNERELKVHDGVCLQTAYSGTDSLLITVGQSGQGSGQITIDANPCGESPTISVLTYDANGTANRDLLAPVLTSGENLPKSIDPLGSTTVTITTKPNLSGIYTLRTSLDVRIDNGVISVPVILEVDSPSSVSAEEHAERLDLSVAPNPTTGPAVIRLDAEILRDAGREVIEIINTAGVTVRSFPAEMALDGLVEWDGRNGAGEMVPAGVYMVKVGEAIRNVIRQ